MDGGALLGQGTYGCVFDPPLLCKGAQQLKRRKGATAKVVGKLSQVIDTENELEAARTLVTLPKYDTYFVLPDPSSVCKPKPVQEQTDKKGIRQCEAIQRFGNEGMVHFLMPFGGLSIRPHLEGGHTTKPLPALPFFKRLLEAGALLAIRGYVHYDLHLGNILIDAKTLLPRIIDFGMSFSARAITEDVLEERWKVYSPDHGAEPPEVTIITGLRNSMAYSKTIRDVALQKETLRAAEKFLGLSRMKQLRDFNQFWKTSQAVARKDWTAFFKLYWPAFDAWGVGFILIQVYRHLIQSPAAAEQPDWVQAESRIKDVLRGLLRMDPRLRMDCVEALQHLDPEHPILSSAPGMKWIQEKEALRATLERGEAAAAPA